MSFLAPLALIATAIIGPIILAMYLLKLRREERTVSSTFLWGRMVRDVEANAPWQKLRRNWLLLLQLLILLLLALALARPFFMTAGIAGRNLILIIDRSASMGATDVSSNRLQAARDEAIRLIDQLPDQGRATVIAAGGSMAVPASATSNRRELRSAIEQIELHYASGSDLTQPLMLASALAAREDDSEIVLISDGNVSIPSDLTVPTDVRYFPIGRSDNNMAISAMALQPIAGGQNLFVQVSQYGSDTVTRRVDIALDDTLFNAYNVTLEPGQSQSIVVEVPAQVAVAQARLADGDDFPLDDRAWAVSRLGEATNVRLVSPGNRFLETALDLMPGVNTMLVPETTTAFAETVAQVPVTILDGVVPPELPPGNLSLLRRHRAPTSFRSPARSTFR